MTSQGTATATAAAASSPPSMTQSTTTVNNAHPAVLTDGCPRIERQEGDHPLQTAWAFWYDQKLRPKVTAGASDAVTEYRSNLHKLCVFDSVEGLWKLYCHLKRPSSLDLNVNMYFFRDGPSNIPMWEAYPHGGCWILKVKKRKDGQVSVLGKMWQDLVIAAVGEAFEEPDVVGISVCIRRNEDLLSVWNADNRNPDIRFNIGEKLKRILDLEPATIIEYKNHSESMQDRSTFRNAKPYVFAAAAEPAKN